MLQGACVEPFEKGPIIDRTSFIIKLAYFTIKRQFNESLWHTSVMEKYMILVRTPLRISFVGGGTDLPFFYETGQGGEVVSVTPNLYLDVWVRRRNTPDIGLNAQTYGDFEEIPNSHIREAFRRTGVTTGVYLFTASDVSTTGTGLGSSSALLVSVLNALYRYQGIKRLSVELANEACDIEMNVLNLPSGKQDAYSTACGGLNYMKFYPDGTVRVYRIQPSRETWRHLETRMMLFYTGIQRHSDTVLKGYKENKVSNFQALCSLKHLVLPFKAALEAPSRKIGELLHEAWLLKRNAAPTISNPEIDALYERARDAGAIGGKVLGAGGGGFILFYVPPDKQKSVRAALKDLQEFPVSYDRKGTQVLCESAC